MDCLNILPSGQETKNSPFGRFLRIYSANQPNNQISVNDGLSVAGRTIPLALADQTKHLGEEVLLDRVSASLDVDERSVGKVTREEAGVQGGAHQDHLELGILSDQILDDDQQEVGQHVPFVNLIDDQVRDPGQLRADIQPLQQDPR